MPEITPSEIRIGMSDAKTLWRSHGEKLSRGETVPSLRIGIVGSFTLNPLVPFLGAKLLEQGFAPSIALGPYDQIFQVCLDYKAHFEPQLDVLVALWRIEDLMPEEAAAFVAGDNDAFQRALDKVAWLADALARLRADFSGVIIANLPTFPTTLSAHALDLTNPTGLGLLHRAVTSALVEQTSQIQGIRLLDLDALQRNFGLSSSFDARQWYLYHQPFSERFLFEVGALLGRMVTATRKPPRKCIVLDCDNTLWGGIVGEDGVGGIQIGDEFPGSAYRDFQKLLLHWRKQGVLLAIASKNNEADVWEVFEKNSSMVLKRDDISAWAIDWNPKAENIPALAKALNIGTDSLVFVDDNPMEIEYMRAARPEVLSILVPEEAAEIVATLGALTCLDRLEVTREDRQRANMMSAERERKSAAAALSKEDFQRSLELRLEFFSAEEADIDRIAQLINKTNQFNLTTIRRSVEEVRLIANSASHRVFGLRVADKFGDYGLTGVAILEQAPDATHCTVETFLLSCRVLGRGVETALLALLAEEARSVGALELHASFLPTSKNAPAASFLSDHGFQSAGAPLWSIPLSCVPAVPPFIAVTRPGAEAS